MRNHKTTITNLIFSLKKNDERFVKNSGLGYCAAASILLTEKLKQLKIEYKLLYGKYLSDNAMGNSSKLHFKKLVENFPTSNDFHGKVKKQFINNGNKLSNRGGHVVVLVGDTVYDVTSAQFGLPVVYSLDKFLQMWDTVQVVDITLNEVPTTWKQKIMYSYKQKPTTSVSQESYQFGLEHPTQSQEQLPDADRDDFYKWFSLQSKEVQSNSKIVSSQELGQDYMLHIDKQTPDKFIPMMPRSAAQNENNTTARITVSPNIIGCLIGYARAEDDLISGTKQNTLDKTGFRGGYDICEMSFNHCLFPNEKLVFDSQRSQEHWLVYYNKETAEYVPRKIGKLFVSKITYESVSGSLPSPTFELYIEIHKQEGIKFSPNIYLEKGFYFAVVKFDRDKHKGSVDQEKNFTVNKIDPVEYNKQKRLCAALLSYGKSIPNYAGW
ncbi:MAG: hypothetical protein LLG05_08400 [Porphyromonadaceae bacterium]|jgi:hypothetical protein|nr:hypothetical protein [Porphyromonadaceae bacterium]